MHFHAKSSGKIPFMYIFAEPVTEEAANEIQNRKLEVQRAFARDIVGQHRDDPEVQKEWHDIQDRVDNEVDEDKIRSQVEETEEVDEIEDDDATLVESDDAEADLEAEGAEEVEDQNAEETKDQIAEETEDQIAETEDKITKEVEGQSAEETEDQIAEEVEGQNAEEVEDHTTEEATVKTVPEPPKAPLMGWTLAIRNRVNGVYVPRPVQLTSEDNWTVEYHIKEISPESRWTLYSKVQEERRKLIGKEDDEENKGLESYRNVIRNFSNRGRKWRKEQDKVDEQTEKQVYRPLGPGSEKQD